MAVRVSSEDKAALEADARRLGVPVATLVRDLVLKRENGVKSPVGAVLSTNMRVYHIDDLPNDNLRHYTPSLRK